MSIDTQEYMRTAKIAVDSKLYEKIVDALAVQDAVYAAYARFTGADRTNVYPNPSTIWPTIIEWLGKIPASTDPELPND